ncbi:MAG: pyridoxamine 5'-phosphate oxidase family protein [Spirochaetia bacterium]|nr:pyridoxamine 5'-phosphate oxidase family protein [Spirochaetia bacterium]
MVSIPEVVTAAWSSKVSSPVFTTVSSDGTPNSVYASSMWLYGEDKIVIADNYFDKSRKNIADGSTGSILFITDERKAYQIKGTIAYETEGPLFDFMKAENPTRLPGHAAAVLQVEAVYSGSEQLA